MKKKCPEVTTKMDVLRFTFKWLVILTLLSLVVYQVFAGIHLKKVGIPGLMVVEFGDAGGDKEENLLRFDGYYFYQTDQLKKDMCIRFYDDNMYGIIGGDLSRQTCINHLYKDNQLIQFEHYEQHGEKITIELSDMEFSGQLSKNKLVLQRKGKEEIFCFSKYSFPYD